MSDYRKARKRTEVIVGESVRIIRELQELSQNQLGTHWHPSIHHLRHRARPNQPRSGSSQGPRSGTQGTPRGSRVPELGR